MNKSQKVLTPIHPGEVLTEDFMKPLGLTQYRLANEIGVPARRINEIVQEKRAITPQNCVAARAISQVARANLAKPVKPL